MCYFSSDSPKTKGYGRYTANEVPVELCSDVIYRGLGFPEWTRGSYQFNSEELQRLGSYLYTMKGRSSNVRNIVTVLERGQEALSYSIMSEVPERRGAFTRAILRLLDQYGLDGVEIAWEWPGTMVKFGGISSDRESLISLLTDLRSALRSRNKELFFFGAVYPKVLRESYRVTSICQIVDYVTLFTFDMRPHTNNVADVHAPMRNRSFETDPNRAKTNVVDGVDTWIDFGCPPKKMILGIGLFGQAFTLANPAQYNVGAPAVGPGEEGQYYYGGYYPYYEVETSKNPSPTCQHVKNLSDFQLCLLIRSGWTLFYDSVGQMPFAVRGNQWMGFEETNSIAAKLDLVQEKRLGGVVLQYVDYDDFWGFCGSRNPLTTFIYQRLRQIPSDIGFAIEWS
ncbi:AGAP008566-PA-like protein [Anopheles sinensis]|uniref:AGAP008566-PA-like protein n=1 Tax=Anopheles sinensis TaxID=74873 RepID=A0A084VUW1_ANOSI|nr:AGAP008566-PA-like protein [Anopheles sinensis]